MYNFTPFYSNGDNGNKFESFIEFSTVPTAGDAPGRDNENNPKFIYYYYYI